MLDRATWAKNCKCDIDFTGIMQIVLSNLGILIIVVCSDLRVSVNCTRVQPNEHANETALNYSTIQYSTFGIVDI